MKKIYFYVGLLATSLAFTGCNEDFKDWADAQSWAQEAEQGSINGTIAAAVETVNISEIGEDGIALVNFLGADNATEGSAIKYSSLLLNDAVSVPFSTVGNQLVVKSADLASALQASYNSLAAQKRECKFKVMAALVNSDGVAASLPIVSNEVAIAVTPAALPSKADEEAFYYVGGYNGWNLGSPTPMTANGDGTYSCVIELAEGSEWFAFAPQSAVENQNWDNLFRANKNGDDQTSGFFNLDASSGNSFCANIEKAGKYKFTISPKDFTYSYAPFVESLYYAGDANGWGFSPLCKDGNDFVGYYYIYQPDNSSYWGFKITDAANWNNSQFGAGETANSIVSGGGNIQITSESGFYKISINMDNGTWAVTPINKLSLVGSAVNGDSTWGTDYDLEFNTKTMAWEGTYEMTDGEYKIRANHEWILSWGGSLDAMTSKNGGNLSITAGKYAFSFKPNCDGQGVLTVTAAE